MTPPLAVLVLGGALVAGGVVAWRWLGRLTDAYCTMLREDAEVDGAGDGLASAPCVRAPEAVNPPALRHPAPNRAGPASHARRSA